MLHNIERLLVAHAKTHTQLAMCAVATFGLQCSNCMQFKPPHLHSSKVIEQAPQCIVHVLTLGAMLQALDSDLKQKELPDVWLNNGAPVSLPACPPFAHFTA